MKKVFITGIGGQTGSYLAELLLQKGYEVHGLVRRVSSGYDNLRNIRHLHDDPEIFRKNLFFHSGDMGDTASLFRCIQEIMPDEVYNLAAQADVQESFYMPDYSLDINGTGVIRLLEAVRHICPKARIYQASTSELFGAVKETPQNENTPFNPQSPYSIGKLAGYYAAKKYREMYGMFVCNGILFNHESPRRGDDYLTRKVTKAVSRIKYGLQKELRLGNIKSKRDWGSAKEFAFGAWLMLQQERPDDYVLGTGETHTVEEWMMECFKYAGLDWEKCIVIDPKLFRAAEVDILQADWKKANQMLGWTPTIKFQSLLKWMMDSDLELAKKEYESNKVSCGQA